MLTKMPDRVTKSRNSRSQKTEQRDALLEVVFLNSVKMKSTCSACEKNDRNCIASEEDFTVSALQHAQASGWGDGNGGAGPGNS